MIAIFYPAETFISFALQTILYEPLIFRCSFPFPFGDTCRNADRFMQ